MYLKNMYIQYVHLVILTQLANLWVQEHVTRNWTVPGKHGFTLMRNGLIL